jgi:hypothetical protein
MDLSKKASGAYMVPAIEHFDITPITDFLGQPFWQGIGVIAGIVIAASTSRKTDSPHKKSGTHSYI